MAKRAAFRETVKGSRFILLLFFFLASVSAFFVRRDSVTRVSEFEGKPNSVGVCITGQICRLELANKHDYFFKPVKKSSSLYVLVILHASDNCGYTNLDTGTKHFFDDSFDVLAWLTERGIDGDVMSMHTDVVTLNERYVSSLDKRGKVNETQRAQHHYFQWQNLNRCYSALRQVGDFDVFVKLRDDSLFVSEFKLDSVLKSHGVLREVDFAKSKLVFVPSCLRWGGINDKSAVVLAGAAESFFYGPLHVYHDHYNELSCSHSRCQYRFNTFNPESFLQQTLEYLLVEVVFLSGKEMPILTGSYGRARRLICFPREDRQFGLERACLPEHLRHRLINNCLVQVDIILAILLAILLYLVCVSYALSPRKSRTRLFSPQPHY